MLHALTLLSHVLATRSRVPCRPPSHTPHLLVGPADSPLIDRSPTLAPPSALTTALEILARTFRFARRVFVECRQPETTRKHVGTQTSDSPRTRLLCLSSSYHEYNGLRSTSAWPPSLKGRLSTTPWVTNRRLRRHPHSAATNNAYALARAIRSTDEPRDDLRRATASTTARFLVTQRMQAMLPSLIDDESPCTHHVLQNARDPRRRVVDVEHVTHAPEALSMRADDAPMLGNASAVVTFPGGSALRVPPATGAHV